MEAIKNKIMNMDEIQLKKKGRAIQSIFIRIAEINHPCWYSLYYFRPGNNNDISCVLYRG